MTASRFREARFTCLLSLPAAAKLLRVTERTVQNWEAGRVRVPYAAYKLMRILRGYELPHSTWTGFRVVGDTLWTPEGRPFRPSDMSWWSLTCRMAAEFRAIMAAHGSRRVAGPGAEALGLVYSKTSDTPDPGIAEIPGNSRLSAPFPQGPDLGAKTPPRSRRLPRHLVRSQGRGHPLASPPWDRLAPTSDPAAVPGASR